MPELNISKEFQNRFMWLGIYQVAGGVFGFGVTIRLLAQQGNINGLMMILFLVVLFLYCYCTYCGILLIRKKRRGILLSMINQYLQLLSFAIAGYAFYYVSGAVLSLGCDLSEGFNMLFNFQLGSVWKVNIQMDKEQFYFNFNFIALLAIIYMERLKTKMDQPTEDVLDETFGQYTT